MSFRIRPTVLDPCRSGSTTLPGVFTMSSSVRKVWSEFSCYRRINATGTSLQMYEPSGHHANIWQEWVVVLQWPVLTPPPWLSGVFILLRKMPPPPIDDTPVTTVTTPTGTQPLFLPSFSLVLHVSDTFSFYFSVILLISFPSSFTFSLFFSSPLIYPSKTQFFSFQTPPHQLMSNICTIYRPLPACWRPGPRPDSRRLCDTGPRPPAPDTRCGSDWAWWPHWWSQRKRCSPRVAPQCLWRPRCGCKAAARPCCSRHPAQPGCSWCRCCLPKLQWKVTYNTRLSVYVRVIP